MELEAITPDILCLNETALYKYEIENLALDKFSLMTHHCRGEGMNRGGGVAIYISTAVISLAKPIQLNTASIDRIVEFAAVQLLNSFYPPSKNCSAVVVAMYRPPRTLAQDIDTFFAVLEKLLDEITMRFPKSMVILLGDLNICQMKPSRAAERLTNILLSYNLQSCVKEPTRVTPQGESALDVVITNLPKESFITMTHSTSLSDHYGVSLAINTPNVTAKHKTYSLKRKYNARSKSHVDEFLAQTAPLWLQSALLTSDPNE